MTKHQENVNEVANRILSDQLKMSFHPVIPISAEERTYEENKDYDIPIDLIHENPAEIRQHLDPNELITLKNSIQHIGQTTSIILTEGRVRTSDDSTQEKRIYLISGQRRLRACQKLGQKTIRARFIYHDLEKVSFEDNLARADIPYIDIAEYIDTYHLSTDYLTKKLNISEQTVSDYRTLMKLDKEIRDKVRNRPDIPKRDMLRIARKPSDKQMEAFKSYLDNHPDKNQAKTTKQKITPREKAYRDICKYRDYLKNNVELLKGDMNDVLDELKKIISFIHSYNKRDDEECVTNHEE